MARWLLTMVLGFAAAALAGSCRVPTPQSIGGRVISCSTEAVKTQWPKVVGPVNDCLTRPDGSDWRACLDVITSTADVAIDVVACVVKGQGASFADSAAVNPDDTRSARAAHRARQYVEGVRFEGDGP